MSLLFKKKGDEGACELKISKFGGLRAKIWAKIEAVEAKISQFSQKGILWTDSFAWNGTLANCRRGVKRVSSGPHILIPGPHTPLVSAPRSPIRSSVIDQNNIVHALINNSWTAWPTKVLVPTGVSQTKHLSQDSHIEPYFQTMF